MNPVKTKFDEIHKDLESNVTKIYMRGDLLTAYDLVAHSVLQFYFRGDLVRKGLVEALAIGDTRCGKSETVQRLGEHYRIGAIVTGENASFAGLIGGMQQTQKTWSITWGQIPLNDKRMVVIEETSGLPIEIIGKMSGVRSSGVAEIIKIQSERTLARARIFWLSNPRGKRPLAGFNSGIEAIQDLFGAPEDVARLDFAMTVASNEVPLAVINSSRRPVVEHRYTSELCRRLVYWAWSRKPNQIVFVGEAEDAILDCATTMARKYVAPLVEGAEQRIKIARLSVAAAARVFSCTPDFQSVVVTPAHVEFVTQYLDEIYSKPSMAFDAHSRAKIAESSLDDVQAIQDQLDSLGPKFIRLVSDAQSFTAFDIQDYAAIDRDAAHKLASFFVQNRCVRKGKFGYYKLPAFTNFLRHYQRGAQHRQPGDDGPPF